MDIKRRRVAPIEGVWGIQTQGPPSLLQGLRPGKQQESKIFLLLVQFKDKRYILESLSKWAWDRIIEDMFYEKDSWKMKYTFFHQSECASENPGDLKAMCS